MYLFRHVMDKELVDRAGFKAGKVDDIVLEMRSGDVPAVRAIVTSHGALIPILPPLIGRMVTWLERQILGLGTFEPREVAWKHVSHIDVVVHLDLKREDAGLIHTQETIWRRYIQPLPGGSR
jgi:sporulation protein YlmC with PRC-barrel domain